jgi:hypothetical protein
MMRLLEKFGMVQGCTDYLGVVVRGATIIASDQQKA